MNKRISRETEIAIIGGTGLESLLDSAEHVHMGTPYGFPPVISAGEVEGRNVAFLPRHGHEHSVPPHKVNYRANIYALYEMGVNRIVATNAVGAINPDFKPTDIVIPHDLIDFTKQRPPTFYEKTPVTHIDFSQPYCPEVRKVMIERTKEIVHPVWDQAVYVCTEGPRFETPAEIRMFRALGCDIVGMTSVPEAVLARELGICYAALCFVSNMAAGIKGRLTSKEVIETSRLVMPKIQQILIETIRYLPKKRHCQCASALEEARIGGERRC